MCDSVALTQYCRPKLYLMYNIYYYTIAYHCQHLRSVEFEYDMFMTRKNRPVGLAIAYERVLSFKFKELK